MYEIPSLRYKYSDLEPYIDEETMRLHHTKHHQTYVDKLNAALESHSDLFKLSIEDLLRDLNQVPEQARTAVRNHGGGHYNHSFFWTVIGPSGGAPREQTIAALDKFFNSYDGFKEKFSAAAANHFGSGWTWLVKNNDRLEIVTSANQDTPLSEGQVPILTLDLWEHAYYLKYQNRRAEYIEAFFKIINWDEVEKRIAGE